jgi:hypothetical protein
MHPDISKALITQHRDELVRSAALARRPGRRRPRGIWAWRVSWTRTVLAPAAGGAGAGGSSLVIIISAHRPA